MNIDRKKALILFVGLLVLSAAACRFSTGLVQHSSTNEMSGHFTSESNTEVHTIEVVDGMTSMRIHGIIKLDDGSVNWFVMDPDNEIIWEGDTSKKRTTINEKMSGLETGTWVLHLELQQATGSYDITWTAE